MWESIRSFLDVQLFKVGSASITLGGVLYFAILLLLLLMATSRIRKWLVGKALARTSLDVGARQAIGSIFQYSAVLLGLLIILQTAGIDLTTLNVVAGALGVGLGFGLQNVASNFVSGLIILLERPVKVGDRIEVGDVEGDVVEIRARSTTVLTNENIAIILPNSKFISEPIINWSYNDTTVRFSIPVGVSYGVDVRLVEDLLLRVAWDNSDVMKHPEPVVRFIDFGDSSLNFELRVWSTTLMHRKGKLRSDLNFAIYKTFAEHHIPIPFPQRDIHIIGGVDVRTDKDRPSPPQAPPAAPPEKRS
ncbi:MAG TPA: mechanosensitive ion channel domain-containing protein [Terriglobia bacterium]|nr:mechanosensitive ion channel domain-containing protein [Terriglobia bacterium]